jgi:hypothetical protein
MSTSAASVTLTDLFSVPSTFQIVLGLDRVCIGILQCSTSSGNMKLSVVPMSMSALTPKHQEKIHLLENGLKALKMAFEHSKSSQAV